MAVYVVAWTNFRFPSIKFYQPCRGRFRVVCDRNMTDARLEGRGLVPGLVVGTSSFTAPPPSICR